MSKIQQCGNCIYFDQESAKLVHGSYKFLSECTAPLPDSCYDEQKMSMLNTEGKDCPVYKEK